MFANQVWQTKLWSILSQFILDFYFLIYNIIISIIYLLKHFYHCKKNLSYKKKTCYYYIQQFVSEHVFYQLIVILKIEN